MSGSSLRESVVLRFVKFELWFELWDFGKV